MSSLGVKGHTGEKEREEEWVDGRVYGAHAYSGSWRFGSEAIALVATPCGRHLCAGQRAHAWAFIV